jgi:hypothetical protein
MRLAPGKMTGTGSLKLMMALLAVARGLGKRVSAANPSNAPLIINGTYELQSALAKMPLQSCSGAAYVAPSPADPRVLQFTIRPALDGSPQAVSLQATAPDINGLWLAVAPSSRLLSFLSSPDPSHASFAVVPGLSDPADGYSFRALSSNRSLLGEYIGEFIGVGDLLVGPCSTNFTAPAGSASLVDGTNTVLATWYLIYVPPPPPPAANQTARLWVPKYAGQPSFPDPQVAPGPFPVWGAGGVAVSYHIDTYACNDDNGMVYGSTPFLSLSLTPSSGPWTLGQGMFWLSDVGNAGCPNCLPRGAAFHPTMPWAVAVYQCMVLWGGGTSTTIVANITWTGQDLGTAVIGPSAYWDVGFDEAFFSPSGRFFTVGFSSPSGASPFQWCIAEGFPQNQPQLSNCPTGDLFAWAGDERFFVLQTQGSWNITLYHMPGQKPVSLPATKGVLLTTPALPSALLVGSTLFADPIANASSSVRVPALSVPGRTILGWSPSGSFGLVADWNVTGPCPCTVSIVGGSADPLEWESRPVLILECSDVHADACGAEASWGAGGILLGPTAADPAFARMFSQGSVEEQLARTTKGRI